MRDETWFSEERLWTAEDSEEADRLLGWLSVHRDTPLGEVVRQYLRDTPASSVGRATRVWERLQTFPHVFEVAAVTRTLQEYDQEGRRILEPGASEPLASLNRRGWTVPVEDFRAYTQTGELSTDLLYLFVQALGDRLGPDCCVRAKNHTRRDRAVPDFRPAGWRRRELPSVQVFPFQSRSKAWCLYVVHLRTPERADPRVQALRARHAPGAAFESTDRMLRENYRAPSVEVRALDLEPGCELHSWPAHCWRLRAPRWRCRRL